MENSKRKRRILALCAVFSGLVLAVSVSAAEVWNVTAKQRYLWNGLVDITCTVTGIDETTDVKFAVAAVMPDSGNVREVSHFWIVQNGTNLTSHVVRTNGDYRLVWDAQSDLGPVIYSNMVVRVTLDVHRKVQLWEGGPYWADTNIGAEEPWEYGYYFWWGDTVGYKRENDVWVASDGSSSNFSFYPSASSNVPTEGKSIAILKSEGWITGGAVLAPKHDAAQVQWGGGWRMPKYSELSALNNNCNWTWTTMNGVNGYVVRGQGDYASASIFLPATDVGNMGAQYWSSVPFSDGGGEYSLYLLFHSRGHNTIYNIPRGSAGSVRPVQSVAE